MRPLFRLTTLGLGLVLVACSSGSSTDSTPVEPVAPTVTSPVNPIDPAPPGGAQSVEPRAGMDGVRSIPFDSVTPSADDRSLTVAFTGGVAPCFVLDRVEVDLEPDAVTVTLYAGSEPTSEPVACIAVAAFYETTVELGEPLAGRPVLDGAPGAIP